MNVTPLSPTLSPALSSALASASSTGALSPTGMRGDPSPGTVLVCQESPTGAANVIRTITGGGWECVVAQNIDRTRWLSSVRNFCLIVLLGDSPAWTFKALAAIRPGTRSPVLVLSPHPDAQAKLLDLGADMVLSAPVGDALLRSAIRAVVRRSPSNAPTLRYLAASHGDGEGLRLDLGARRVTVGGRLVDLSPTEFDVLHFLMAHSQVVVRHHAIIKAVWSWKYTDERNALRIHINRLRRKIGDPSDQPRYIRCLRGTGYCFIQPVSEFTDDQHTAGNDPGRDNTNLLLEGQLRKINHALLSAQDRYQACAALVEIAVSESLCDAAAVFARRSTTDSLHLVTQAGMPPEWETAVAAGVPLGKQFVSSDTVNSAQIRNYVDVGKLTNRYGPTARLLRAAGLPVILSVPLVNQHGAWGQLGCARRSDSAFTPTHCIVLEAAGYLLGALFDEESPLATAG
jgi:DNA-binding response OmpR family regulator